MRYFLGIEVHHYENAIFISQYKYENDFLKIFKMVNCKAAPTPVIIGLKLGKDDDGSNVDPMPFKG